MTSAGSTFRAQRVVGRETELAALRTRLDGTDEGTDTALLLVGEAGFGKSRLRREAESVTAGRDGWVLRGSAVDTTAPQPYRALAEALGDFDNTSRSVPGDRLWVAWDAARRSLRSPAGGPTGVAEEIVRMLRLASRRAPVLLTLDDVQWADDETGAVITYLCDHGAAHGASLVLAARPELDPGGALSRLEEQRTLDVLELGPLADEEVDAMVLECLRADAAPAELLRFIRDRAAGSPFAVEELLAGLTRSGTLVRDGETWHVVAPRLSTLAPPTVAASVARRVATLPPTAREVLRAAAILGHRFDWQLLSAVVEHTDEEVLAALEACHDAGLLSSGGNVLVFRHALTRDEVLRGMLAPDRRRMAARAYDVVTASPTDHPAASTSDELALELAEHAGDNQAWRRILLRTGARAADSGALGSAVSRLTPVVRDASPDELTVEAWELLAQVYADMGDIAAARAAADAAIGADVIPGHRARSSRLQLVLARAAVAAGDVDGAAALLTGWAGADQLSEESMRHLLLQSQVHLARGNLPEAARLAEEVAGDAELTAIRCEALEILGRCARVSDVAAAEAWFRKELAEADAAGDGLWQVRALHELGTIDLLDSLRLDHLEEARRRAVETSVPSTLVLADFHLAEALVARGETLAGRLAAERAADLAGRIGSPVLPWAWLTVARSLAPERDDPALDAAVEQARATGTAEPEAVAAGISGRVRAMRSLFGACPDEALAHLDEAVARLRELPGHHFQHWGLWLLLRTLDESRMAPEHLAETRAAAGAGTRFNLALTTAAEAVAAGCSGNPETAAVGFDRAVRALTGYERAEWMVHLTRWLVLRAAHEAGWGDPVGWAQEAVRWFSEHDQEPLAADCRLFLRGIGAIVPRRGRGRSQVPTSLRERGVTSREVDVLGLIALRLPNAEIASRLVLSPRTVERHVSNLLAKTGAVDRRELAILTEELGLS